jgi:ABC-type Fe3+-hydroxamate transport system substrate-binding protein
MTVRVRIASLVPSITELLFALGLGPRVVARTGYCTRPAEAVAAVPKVGGTKDVNLAKLRRLAPTHAIVNVDENRAETAEALRAFVPQVIVTHPCGPRDVDALISQIADAFAQLPGVTDRAAALRSELRTELAAMRARPDVPVLYLIWREPWMTVARDTYISRLLA